MEHKGERKATRWRAHSMFYGASSLPRNVIPPAPLMISTVAPGMRRSAEPAPRKRSSSEREDQRSGLTGKLTFTPTPDLSALIAGARREGDEGAAWRYALVHLNPFVVHGDSTLLRSMRWRDTRKATARIRTGLQMHISRIAPRSSHGRTRTSRQTEKERCGARSGRPTNTSTTPAI